MIAAAGLMGNDHILSLRTGDALVQRRSPGASYISGVSCARTTWLGLISTLKIRLEPVLCCQGVRVSGVGAICYACEEFKRNRV